MNGSLWFTDEPMKGDGIALDNSRGVYAFKTLAEAKANVSANRGKFAVGSVKMWGTVVEHERGYRAERAMIHQIIDGPNLTPNEAPLKKTIAKERARMPQIEQRHGRDKDTYRFRCERYGDFLSIFMEREGKKLASAILLIGVGAITLSEGRPAQIGSAQFYVTQHSRFPELLRFDDNCGNKRLLGSATDQTAMGFFPFPMTTITVGDCPMSPVDDTITFSGTGVVIYAPHGLGEGVYQQILAATRAAFSGAAA